jgi:hypothetical protein
MKENKHNYEDDVADFNTDETELENSLPATTAPPLTPAKLANFKKLAVETSGQLGALIKFIKGRWLTGDDEITGERRIAHIDQLACGYIKFADGKVVDRRIGKVADGFEMPKREELGDTDERNWETDAAGNTRDPWVKQYFLPLSDLETGAVAVYVTASVGGIGAIGTLCGIFADNTQNGLPIVRLAVSSYKHKHYGHVEVPDLQVVRASPTITADLGDNIPF